MKYSFFSRFRQEIEDRFDLNYFFIRRKFEKRTIDSFLESHPLKISPKFSIVIPTYGISPVYLKECFDSIERQTYSNWEICICDDADPIRESAQFVSHQNKKNPDRYKLKVHEVNQGICAATRTALKLAQGEFVVFMDADDTLHPKALESLAHAIDSADIDFVYTNHDHMTDWGLRIKPMLKPGWSPELLLHVNYINHLTCVRRSLLEKNADEFFPQFSVGAQDWDLCLKMILFARRVRHIPLILYHWRARPGSMAEHPATKPWAIRNQLEVRQKIAPFLGPKVRFDTNSWTYKSLEEPSVLEFRFVETEAVAQIFERLTAVIDESDAETVLFSSDSSSNSFVKNTLRGLIPYSQLSHVACVWPFLGPGLRTAYTVSDSDSLVPVNSVRSTFSSYSSNVLTGPLNGLVIEVKKLREVLIFMKGDLSEAEKLSFTSNTSAPSSLGAAIGLASILLKYRNMSANAAVLPQDLSPVVISSTLLPVSDCYL